MTTIYHNPRCSKSRATLELLKSRGIDPNIVLYLQQPLDMATLQSITQQLGCSMRDIMRQGDPIYKQLELAHGLTEQQLIEAVIQHPQLLERPIVVHNGKAALGRPPENVLSIIAPLD